MTCFSVPCPTQPVILADKMQPDDFGRSAYVKVAPHSILRRHAQLRLGIGEDRLTQRAGSEPALGGCLDDENDFSQFSISY